ncbi:MAG: hypothetical protein ACK56I_33525, partial [bacterium]
VEATAVTAAAVGQVVAAAAAAAAGAVAVPAAAVAPALPALPAVALRVVAPTIQRPKAGRGRKFFFFFFDFISVYYIGAVPALTSKCNITRLLLFCCKILKNIF